METRTLGNSWQARLDHVTADAQAALDSAIERMRALAGELRAGYAEAIADAPTVAGGQVLQPDAELLAPARVMLGRLEMAEQQLREAAHMVGRGATGPEAGRAPAQPLPSDTLSTTAALEGREQERSRLAEELHDGPAQAISNILFQTEILGHAIRTEPAAAESELASLRQLLQRELDRLRAYINELRPPLMEPGGLEEALREAASDLSSRVGIPVDVELQASSLELDEAERAVALRVAQEALRNVGKHAAAKRAWVTTRISADDRAGEEWQLEVGDDGRGFDPDDAVVVGANRRHFGLRFMRERAQLLGAHLAINANPSAGTVIRLAIRRGGDRS